MITDLDGKRVLVLSDNDGLSRAIAFNLYSRLGVEITRLVLNSSGWQRNSAGSNSFDLIVLAMSSPTSEPIVVLSRASLTEHIGKIPLLIISNKPFDSDPEDRIVHLDFPFDIDKLRRKVREILQA